MGPPDILVPDILKHQHHFTKCGDVNIDSPRGIFVGNNENSTHNEHILTQEQILDPAKLKGKFNAKNKPLPK